MGVDECGLISDAVYGDRPFDEALKLEGIEVER